MFCFFPSCHFHGFYLSWLPRALANGSLVFFFWSFFFSPLLLLWKTKDDNDHKDCHHLCLLIVIFMSFFWPSSLLWKIKNDDDHKSLSSSPPIVLTFLKHENNGTKSSSLCLFFLLGKKKTTRSWSFLVSNFCWCCFQREISSFYASGLLRKVENSINGLSVCLLMCCFSFVNVGPFKKFVFILFNFERTCFVLSWLFFHINMVVY
jgi:hypothetical protein